MASFVRIPRPNGGFIILTRPDFLELQVANRPGAFAGEEATPSMQPTVIGFSARDRAQMEFLLRDHTVQDIDIGSLSRDVASALAFEPRGLSNLTDFEITAIRVTFGVANWLPPDRMH